MVFSITSCTKENNEDDGTPKNWTNPNGQSNPGVTEDMTVLSNQKPNPYNIDTMKHASRIVRGSDAEIQTNFLYIRFEPADLDELQLLEDDSTLFLSDTPLDYEFSIEGTYYHDPNISDEDPTYYYCVIGVNQATPNVSYTTLDDLYIPNIDTESDIECEALDLCNINYMTGNDKGMFRTKPDGQITVSVDGSYIGVNNVKVIAYNWFRNKSTYTDINGNFSIDKKFRRARIKVKYISNKATMRMAREENIYRMLSTYKTKIKNGSGYEFVNSELNNISFNYDYYSDITTKGAENWNCAVVWNSIYEGHKYAGQMGINKPPNGLVVYLTSYLSEGAAPMLNNMGRSGYNVFKLNEKIEYLQEWYFIAADILTPTLTLTLLAVLQKETPDIVIGMEDSRLFEEVEGMTIHELGHSIHYLKAGPVFWEAEIEYIVDNDGYGTKTSTNSGICALTESWANYFQAYAYMLKNDNSQHTVLQSIEYMIGGGGFDWFPSGMYWDLFDHESTLPAFLTENPLINDNVSGITIPDVYDLFSNCSDIDDFKSKLKINYPNQATDIEYLFESYGY